MRKPATVAAVGGERKTEGEGLRGWEWWLVGWEGGSRASAFVSGVGRNGEISGFRLSLGP